MSDNTVFWTQNCRGNSVGQAFCVYLRCEPVPSHTGWCPSPDLPLHSLPESTVVHCPLQPGILRLCMSASQYRLRECAWNFLPRSCWQHGGIVIDHLSTSLLLLTSIHYFLCCFLQCLGYLFHFPLVSFFFNWPPFDESMRILTHLSAGLTQMVAHGNSRITAGRLQPPPVCCTR